MTSNQMLWIAMLVSVFILTAHYVWLGFIPGKYCTSVFMRDRQKNLLQAIGSLPRRTIYVITPTYRRPQQLAELTRLAQTLMHVPDLVWLVIEDATVKTNGVEALLKRTQIEFVHLIAPMPEIYKNKTKDLTTLPRGVSNRNRGLQWLRANATSGVLYFADDDNSYDTRLFKEMRDTVRVSMWPVGLLSGGLSSPIIRNNQVVGFYTGWTGNRIFQVDMAGFAVSVEFLLKRPKAKMPYTPGFEEDNFLQSLHPFSIQQIEYKASNCTEVLVWHTQTKTPDLERPLDLKSFGDTNLVTLYNSLR